MSAAPILPSHVPYIADRALLAKRIPSPPVRPPALPRDTRPTKDRDSRYGVIVRELTEPTFGDYKVLQRVDGLFTVIDLHAGIGATCPCFTYEIDARAHASHLAAAGVADAGRKF